MTITIDISAYDGILLAEPKGNFIDYTPDTGYLFSIDIDDNNKCNVRYENKNTELLEQAAEQFTGLYYITIPTEFDGELHITNNFAKHFDHNTADYSLITKVVDFDYAGTVKLDMINLSALFEDKTGEFEEIILSAVFEDKTREFEEIIKNEVRG